MRMQTHCCVEKGSLFLPPGGFQMLVRDLLLSVCLLGLLPCCASDAEVRTPAVLVIGIDGVRPDALQQADTPHLDRLAREGAVSWDAYAGGRAGEDQPTQQATSSGPGWSSILTGVWRDRHQVADNSFEGNNLEQYPHIFVRIREQRPEAMLASIVHWNPIHEHLLKPFPGAASFLVETETDQEVESGAVALLGEATPDVLFLHFDDVDHAGHAHGYSTQEPEYLASIEQVDEHVGRVLDALQARPSSAEEDWLILLTTDHGGRGTSHGGQSAEERTIWVIAHGRGVSSGVVSPGPGHTVIARSVLDHLKLEVPASWGLADQKPFADAAENVTEG